MNGLVKHGRIHLGVAEWAAETVVAKESDKRGDGGRGDGADKRGERGDGACFVNHPRLRG